MPVSNSPRLLSPAEISGDIRPQENETTITRAELSIRTQGSPPPTSPRPEETMSMANADRAFVPSDNMHTHYAPMMFDTGSMQWSAPGQFSHNGFAQDAFYAPAPFGPNTPCAEYSQQAFSGMSYNANHTIKYPLDFMPRSFQNNESVGRPVDMTTTYPPSAYFHSPPDLHSTPSLSDSTPELRQLNDDWDIHYGAHISHEDQRNYNSPYSDMSRASTPYSYGIEDEPIDKEQPYAQLIYRALLDAPEHTMVLRDIYDWFRKHTDKATHSETKGWQNSIRHNLSMNGAFEKVDSPTESTTKGFMWRLTPAALREGVKSTTRYRSKAPNKRSHRTQPQPQRQASGAKGGHAARRAANIRRSQRARQAGMYHRHTPSSDPYSNSGYGSEWEDTTIYTPSSARPSQLDTPYTHMTLPYDVPRNNPTFSPMLGMASHLVSPPHSYASTPATPGTSQGFLGDTAYILDQAPGEPLFGGSGSPTPSADEPITPVDARHPWEQDITMGIDVDDQVSQFGGPV